MPIPFSTTFGTLPSGGSDYIWIHSNNAFTYPIWVEGKMDSFDAAGATLRFGQSTGTILKANGNYYNEYSADAFGGLYRIIGDDSTGACGVASTPVGDTSGIWSFVWSATGSQKFNVNYASKLTGSDSTYPIGNYYLYLGLATWVGGDAEVDWARARKYTSPEPTTSVGGEERLTISKIAFTTSAQTIAAGTASGLMTIQTQSAYNNPVNLSSSTTINLTSTSSTGRFDTSATGAFNGSITSVTINEGSNSASFYYKDTTAGTPTITASYTGWTSAETSFTITGWLSGWSYREPITITERSGTNLTDYQVLLTVDTQSLISDNKLQSGCQDIRFTKDDGSTPIPYWTESGRNTSSTEIWVKVPSLPASSTKTILMYYGNPSASAASNGTATFEFFDDFEGTSLDTSKWTKQNSAGGSSSIANSQVTFSLSGGLRPITGGNSI